MGLERKFQPFYFGNAAYRDSQFTPTASRI
jgi:hypothetical protein